MDGTPVWVEEPATKAQTNATAHRRFAIATLVATLLGVNLGLVSWVRPIDPPYFVPLWVTQYRSPYVATRFAAEADRDAVVAGNLFPRTANTYTSQEYGLLLRELDSLPRTSRQERLVVYLSGYARAREGTDIDLLPADADLPAGPLPIPIRDVLRKVKAAPARAKLLILDLDSPRPDPQAGLLRMQATARFSDLLQEVEKEYRKAHPDAKPDLLVLLTAAPGQIAAPARVLGRSPFGYYFERGLQGEAILYDPEGARHGRRITARGLAAYLTPRVDRFAREALGTRQTPILLGDGPDFDLATAAPLPPAPALPQLSDPGTGPVADAWRTLANWRNDGSISAAPRAYLRLQDAVTRAEVEFAAGGITGVTANDLKFALDHTAREMAQAKAQLPRPDHPPSLAFAELFGSVPDAALGAGVDDLLTKVHDLPPNQKPEDRAAAIGKLVEALVKSAEGKPGFAIEQAVFSRAADAVGHAADLELLDSVLAARKVQAAYIETRFLRRMAALAKKVPAADWPAELAREAIVAVGLTEKAAARPDSDPWTGPLYEEAAAARWEAEVLTQYWQSIPVGEISRRFRDASRRAGIAVAFADAQIDAREEADTNLASLIPAVSAAVHEQSRLPSWNARLEALANLLPLLEAPAKAPDTVAVQALGDKLRGRGDSLQEMTESFDRVVSGAGAMAWVQAAARPHADAQMLRLLDGLLTLPRMDPATRIEIEKSRDALSVRLANEVRDADAADEAAGRTTMEVPFPPEESAAARKQEVVRATIRARCNVRMLNLIGIPATGTKPISDLIDRGLREGPDSDAWAKISDSLGYTWNTGLLDLYGAGSPAVRDRISSLMPTGQTVPVLDTTPGGYRAEMRRKVWKEHFVRVASSYRSASQAGVDTEFMEGAASSLLGGAAAVPYPVPSAPAPNAMVLSTTGSATATLKVTQPVVADGAPEVRVLDPGPGLRTSLSVGEFVPDPVTGGLIGTVVVKADVVPPLIPGRIPPGIVVEMRTKGRSGFVQIPVDSTAAVPPIELVFDRVPSDPVGIGDEFTPRPGQPQPLYVFVRNRSTTPRSVLVAVAGPNGPIAGASATVAVGANETKLAAFGGGSAAPAAPGATAAPAPTPIPFPAVLTVTATDTVKPNDVLVTRKLTIASADPSRYVEIVSTEFFPTNPPSQPQNRLAVTMRATRNLGPVPCQATLVLDPKLIPGLGAVMAGQLTAPLPPSGLPITLDASGLVLSDEAKRAGVVTISVDGMPRTFRLNVDFARFGQPTFPAIDNSPYLELRPGTPPFPGRSVAFSVAADRAPVGAVLDARLLRTGGGVEKDQTFPAPRRERGTVATGAPSGGLNVTATVDDWSVAWDTPDLLGKRTIQARLRDATGKVLLVRELPVVLDVTPPVGTAFRDAPTQAAKGTTLKVTAASADPESGIASMSFFLGKPEKDALPANATLIPGVQSPTDPTAWSAPIPIPAKTGPLDVSVRATNGAGLVSFATTSVDVLDALPIPPASIVGVLYEGSLSQANMEVRLLDEAGKNVLQSVKTDATGKFSFTGLKPGNYRLAATKVSSNRKANVPVKAVAGQQTVQNVNLYL